MNDTARNPTDQQARIAELERKLAIQQKINKALMSRVEDSTDSAGDSYSMFVYNLTLQRHVEKQTSELQREIKMRRKREQELREIRETLEQRIAERTAELSKEIETRRQAQAQLQYMAHHDPLTGLANRSLFNERLHRALLQSRRSGKYGALLFLDLDKFKHVNDTLGHAVGDALLIHMANVLQERVRGTDTVARLGGDEFAVIMVDVDCPESAAVLAEDILDKLKKPVTLCGHQLKAHSSIGIVTFPGRANKTPTNMESIIKNADAAMYLAKSLGGMRYRFFESSQ